MSEPGPATGGLFGGGGLGADENRPEPPRPSWAQPEPERKEDESGI